jgi:hypothetical protein
MRPLLSNCNLQAYFAANAAVSCNKSAVKTPGVPSYFSITQFRPRILTSCAADGNPLFLYKEVTLVSGPEHGHQGHQSSLLRQCCAHGLLSISGGRPYIRKLWKLQETSHSFEVSWLYKFGNRGAYILRKLYIELISNDTLRCVGIDWISRMRTAYRSGVRGGRNMKHVTGQDCTCWRYVTTHT